MPKAKNVVRLMLDSGAIRRKWRMSGYNAATRGVPFKLTFEEWCTIWAESGNFDKRGKGRGKYHMCRKGDLRAYEVGNVFIDLHERNTSLPGSKNPFSSLSPSAVVEIRRRYRPNGKGIVPKLLKKFGIKKSALYNVVNGTSYAAQ